MWVEKRVQNPICLGNRLNSYVDFYCRIYQSLWYCNVHSMSLIGDVINNDFKTY